MKNGTFAADSNSRLIEPKLVGRASAGRNPTTIDQKHRHHPLVSEKPDHAVKTNVISNRHTRLAALVIDFERDDMFLFSPMPVIVGAFLSHLYFWALISAPIP